MSYSVIFTSNGLRDAKRLRKKYHSFKNDLEQLIQLLQDEPQRENHWTEIVMRLGWQSAAKTRANVGVPES